ncbi:MAG: ribosome small subunit-dependent GTPase A [Firmicutes bacterium]|jgi:ribosome biogenesis GTPase|nr:ribosome small subunit-dependent GTPase A [Bacillota bacterium]
MAKGGFYFVRDACGAVLRCRARRRIKDSGISLLVGDLVEVNASEGVIEKVYPRKNSIIRPPVANVDQVVILMSVSKPPIDLVLLDRILISVESFMIDVILCLNKMDLINDLQKAMIEEIRDTYENCGYKIFYTSAVTGQGLHQLETFLNNKINVFAGPSGVGKSTLINKLKPGLELKSAPVSSKTERGRHTTRHVELLMIGKATFIADTPGFQKLDLKGFSSRELSSYFPEMLSFAGSCRFTGCIHRAEPDCAVKEAVQRGKIAPWRYNHYLMFLQEILQAEKNF